MKVQLVNYSDGERRRAMNVIERLIKDIGKMCAKVFLKFTF